MYTYLQGTDTAHIPFKIISWNNKSQARKTLQTAAEEVH